ncbi:MAG: YraN family protein [Flavobacteriaceae bacterium]|nr:YraN family protein [Flavobacteriaceae bacterium]
MAKHNEFGAYGEELAVRYLQDKGYQILARNYRYLKAEIDVIALKEELLVVVEVKTRRIDTVVMPHESVRKKKIQLLSQAINAYVEQRNMNNEIRFDLIVVIRDFDHFSLEHIPNAFYHF